MRVPLKLMLDLGRYMRRKRRAGEKYFPLVLMLEPLARMQPRLHRMRPNR